MRFTKRILSDIYRIALRELDIISEDLDLIIILILSPIFYAFFYSSFYINKIEQKANVAAVDYDKTDISKRFLYMLSATQNVNLTYIFDDEESAKQIFLKNETFAILIIPKNFSKNLATKKGTQVSLILNNTRFLVSNDINKAVNEIAYKLIQDYREKYLYSNGISPSQASLALEPIKIELRNNFNSYDTYGDFLIPGILLLIIQQTLLIGISESVAKEREENLFQEVFSSSHSVFSYLIGKSVFYLTLYFSYFLIFFFVISKIISIDDSMHINFLTILVLLIPFLASIILFGMFIGSFFKRKILALQFFVFTSYPFFLISGFSWPFDSLPQPLKIFSLALPTTPFFNGICKALYANANLSNVLFETLNLFLIIIALSLSANFRFRLIKESFNKNY